MVQTRSGKKTQVVVKAHSTSSENSGTASQYNSEHSNESLSKEVKKKRMEIHRKIAIDIFQSIYRNKEREKHQCNSPYGMIKLQFEGAKQIFSWLRYDALC